MESKCKIGTLTDAKVIRDGQFGYHRFLKLPVRTESPLSATTSHSSRTWHQSSAAVMWVAE